MMTLDDPHRPAATDLPLGRKVLFSAMKNEAPFVLEWIAYHKAIGFDDIVICSNPSTDGLEEILAALAAAGEIRHLRTSPTEEQSPQGLASAAFAEQVGYCDGSWYMWLDADEFLNVHVRDRTVGALVQALGDRRCMLVNWRIFGTGGNRRFPGRFVSAAFTKASELNFEGNAEIKSLFQKTSDFKSFATLGINRPLVDPSLATKLDLVATGAGGPPSLTHRQHRIWVQGAEHSKTFKVAPDEVGWGLAQINHYIVRTEEFFALKRGRGDGLFAGAIGAANTRHTPAFFAENDRNEAEDSSILHWDAATTAGIARLMSVPGVASAVQASTTRVAAALAAVADGADGTGTGDEGEASSETFELTLPADEAAYLQSFYQSAGTILEYGSGGSTVVAAKAGARVVSVESDAAWAERMTTHLAGLSATAVVHHVDIGPTRDWGRPLNNAGAARYHRYALSVWDRPDLGDPDIVLIDGRFRAACLAAVRMRATRPTKVLFDDYVSRRYYHAVEKLARKEETIGRMARFTVTPGPIPPDMLTEVIGWFTDPR